jgi:predicted DNA-binding protein YlxM (UPF0122 family)
MTEPKKTRKRKPVLTATRPSLLTSFEFATVIPLLSMSDENVEACRQYLVEGKSLRRVADSRGCSAQNVMQLVRSAQETLDGYRKTLELAGLLTDFDAKVAALKQQEPL